MVDLQILNSRNVARVSCRVLFPLATIKPGPARGEMSFAKILSGISDGVKYRYFTFTIVKSCPKISASVKVRLWKFKSLRLSRLLDTVPGYFYLTLRIRIVAHPWALLI